MRTFISHEELIEFVSNPENVETLDNGEVVVREWNEESKALRKYWKNYNQDASDKSEWKSQRDSMTERVAELTEQLDLARDELAGLKEILDGDEKEMLRKLNAEIILIRGKNMRLEKQVATIPILQKKIDECNASRILEAVKKGAMARGVPRNIIDDTLFQKAVVDEFTIDDIGNIVTKADCTQTVDDYIVAMQKDRPHWQPVPNGGTNVSDDLAAVAGLFESNVTSVKYTRPMNRDDRQPDDLKAIAALFG